MLQIFLIAIPALIVLFLIVVAMQPAAFRIERKALVSAPPAAPFNLVNDFHHWQDWSPWAKLDPTVKNTYEGPASGTDAFFAWSGNNQIGEGKMTIMESLPGKRILIKLEFIRPFRSNSTAEFTFEPKANQTEVTWAMAGAKNFMTKAFGLFMNMDKMVGGDFERGLASMKSLAEGAATK